MYLGAMVDFPIFIKVFYGEGTILLHCSPAVFSNYYLLKSDIKPYTESVLSMLPGKKNSVVYGRTAVQYFRFAAFIYPC